MTFEAFEREAGERLSALTGVAGRVVVGPPGDELLAFADQVDLLVVGSRPRLAPPSSVRQHIG